jgi:hypothetical protein
MGLAVQCVELLHVGGNWNNAANAGVFSFNANNTPTNTNTNIGARLFVCSNNKANNLHSLFLTAR